MCASHLDLYHLLCCWVWHHIRQQAVKKTEDISIRDCSGYLQSVHRIDTFSHHKERNKPSRYNYKMHNIWVRLNAVIFFGLTVLLALATLSAIRYSPLQLFVMQLAATSITNSIFFERLTQFLFTFRETRCADT
jgi:hypothetical protein